jgi:mannose-6-phosphate isomerase-like protein (cupin superfamily)
MNVKSTLKVINSANIESKPGKAKKGHTIQSLIGTDIPTDRMRVTLATFEPNILEKLHWHPIEAFYYIISGHAIVRDIEGNESEVGPGMAIYCPAGLAGAHEWETKDKVQLLAFRATLETNRKFQFTVDKETKRSYIDLDDLIRSDGLSFTSHY